MSFLNIFENDTKSKFVAATVPANSTEQEEIELAKDVTIKHIETRFYPGQQLSLQVKPELKRKESNKIIDLVDYPGDKNHLEGDDDTIPLPTNVEAESEDTITVTAENTDPNNTYDYFMIITLEER